MHRTHLHIPFLCVVCSVYLWKVHDVPLISFKKNKISRLIFLHTHNVFIQTGPRIGSTYAHRQVIVLLFIQGCQFVYLVEHFSV